MLLVTIALTGRTPLSTSTKDVCIYIRTRPTTHHVLTKHFRMRQCHWPTFVPCTGVLLSVGFSGVEYGACQMGERPRFLTRASKHHRTSTTVAGQRCPAVTPGPFARPNAQIPTIFLLFLCVPGLWAGLFPPTTSLLPHHAIPCSIATCLFCSLRAL